MRIGIAEDGLGPFRPGRISGSMDRATLHALYTAPNGNACAIRPGFHHSDLYLLTNANRGVLHGTQRVAPDGWRRFAEYVLDGFRCPMAEVPTPPSEPWRRRLTGHAD